MPIYENDASLNLDEARRRAMLAAEIADEARRKKEQAELTIAALLDVAASLRVIATEAALAMGSGQALSEALGEGESEDPVEEEFNVGGLVRVLDTTDVGKIVDLGIDQGDPFAVVDFETGDGVQKYYLRNLELLSGDEAPEEESEEEESVDDDFAESALDVLDKKAGKKKGKKS